MGYTLKIRGNSYEWEYEDGFEGIYIARNF